MNDCFKNFTNASFQVTIKEFSTDTCPTVPTRVVMQLPSGKWQSGEYTPLEVLLKMAIQNDEDEEYLTFLKEAYPNGEVFFDGREWKLAAKGFFMEITDL